MKDDTVSRVAVMQSLTKEYNRRRTGDGLKLAWIEKAVNDVPAEPFTVNGVTLYPCDPEKNTPCSKTNCFINGGECRRTTHKKYRREQHGSD